ncbi:hypothetical protein GUP89_004190 [Salmonella enterica]|nr:hypothetical protein [Salmonella enterica subsp. enterica serovar 4,[5],12:i:-]EDW6691016.1 hypothetical protein [Salmonella enterica]
MCRWGISFRASACVFTTTIRALRGTFHQFREVCGFNALTCCALRFVELTAGDRAAPDWTYFSVMLMPENQTVMVGAELRHRVVASPAKRALL